MNYRLSNVALRTSLIYGVVAAWWLLYSDRIETSLVTDTRLLEFLQANKAGMFLAVTIPLLYIVLRQQMQRHEQARAALAASEQRLSRIISSAKDPLLIVDPSRRITLFNTAAEQMFGCAAAEAIGQPVSRFIPQICAMLALPNGSAGDTGTAQCSINTTAVLTAVRADGAEFFIEAAGARIVDAGQTLCMISVRDVTERKRADEALHRSEARFMTTFQASPVAQAMLRRSDLQIIDVNRKLEYLLGYGREDLLGHNLHTIGIFPARSMSRLGELRHALQEQYALFNSELTITTKMGEARQALFSTVPFEIDNEACTLLTVQDLTKRRHAEELMQRATERLEVLAAASHAFAQVENDHQAVLEQLTKTAAHLGDGCAIAFLSDDRTYLRLAALYDSDPQISAALASTVQSSLVPADSATMTAHVLRSQPPMHASLADPHQYSLGTQSTIAALIEAQGVSIHSILVVPLRLQGQILGALFLYRRQPERQPFDNDDLTLTQDLADRATLALNHARLYSSLQQSHHDLEARVAERTSRLNQTLERVQDLYAITNDAIMTEHLVEALQRTTERVRATLPADRVVLLTFDWRARRVEHMAYSRAAAPEDGGAVETLPFGLGEIDFEEYMSGLTGWVVSELRPAISPKNLPDPRESAIAQQRRSETHSGSIVVAPLLYLGEVFGTITAINRPDEPDFSADDVEHLTAVAGQISMVYGRNRLVAQLQQANADLARAARLKDEFLANMSHELRTPLNSILGRCQALQDRLYGDLTAKQVDVLRGVEDSGHHLLALINDILDLAKIAAGKLELHIVPVMVAPLCRISMQMVVQAALKKQIEIRTNIAGPVDHFFADERRLKQILVNLLSNAVKFTPEGGSVGLDVQGDAQTQTVTFSVWDTGIGIAKEDQPLLFRQFVQIDSKLSRQYEGSGLGLAMVQQLAEAHGGSVALESEPGQGSCFRVTLPWSRDTDVLPAPHSKAALLAAHS
jgi:PAS domain S-box-containing protein